MRTAAGGDMLNGAFKSQMNNSIGSMALGIYPLLYSYAFRITGLFSVYKT